MSIIIFLIFSLYITSTKSLSGRGGYKEAIESCNGYIDTLFANIFVEYGQSIDPLLINGTVVPFQKKVAFIDFKGEAKLTGQITGLSSLRRIWPCSLTFEDDRYHLSTRLQSQPLFLNLTGIAQVMKMGPTVFVNGNSSSMVVDMAFTVNGTTNKEALLEEFRVKKIENTQITVDGLRLLRWMNEPLMKSATAFYEATMKKVTEFVLGEMLQHKVVSNPFSLEHFEIDENEITVSVTQTRVVSTPNPKGKEEFFKEDSNSYMDSVLENRYLLEAHYGKIEPLFLDNDQIQSPFISNSSQKDKNYLYLKNGQLDNLTQLKRISDCTNPVRKANNITFNCYLGFDELQMKYDAFGENVSGIELIASVTNTRIGVRITAHYKDNVPNLLDFLVNNVGRVTVKVARVIADSLFMTDVVYNREVILRHFSTTLVKVFHGRMKDILNYSIYKTPLTFLE